LELEKTYFAKSLAKILYFPRSTFIKKPFFWSLKIIEVTSLRGTFDEFEISFTDKISELAKQRRIRDSFFETVAKSFPKNSLDKNERIACEYAR
jgi:hypothetical protein